MPYLPTTTLRVIVHKFFFKNELPTLNKILSVVTNDPDLPNISRSTFYKLTSCSPVLRYGKYWDILQSTPGFMDKVEFFYMQMPTEIFGQKLSSGWEQFHGSDVTRLRVLIKYGGIFLDNDSYIVRSLNDFRRYELAIGWDEGGQFLGSQILIAHKDARFLRLWLETYRGAYRSDLWYYNAGERPTTEILYKTPELIHRVQYLFGVHNGLVFKIYKEYWPLWRNMYTIHLLYRHLYILGSFESRLPHTFDEENVKEHGNTFREMALNVYNPDNLTFKYEEVVFEK